MLERKSGVKTEVKKLDNGKKEISVEVSGEVVKNKFEEVFAKITKEAKVPGFRPGNAPRDIIEKQYSSYAHEQVLKELIPEVYNQAIEKEKLDVIELPDISDVKLDQETLSFKAEVQLAPEINLKNYKGLKVNYKKVSVSGDEMKRNLDSLKESRKLAALDDKVARSLGYPDLPELEKAIERQIFLQKDNSQRQRIENEVIESLTKDLDFAIPKVMIERQAQELLRQAKLDMALRGMPKDKIEAQEKELAAHLEPEAKKQVKIYLVLAEIAKKESIALDDHMPRQVMELLLKEADWQEAS
jgi:FKBP-type peptidyl-prolyl cis-trans isomerase (trigger factor)